MSSPPAKADDVLREELAGAVALAVSVIHDMKSMLGAIVWAVERARGTDGDAQRVALDDIERAALSAGGLGKQYMHYARKRAGSKTFDPVAVIEELRPLLLAVVPGLRIETDGESSTMSAESSRVRSLFVALVLMAADAGCEILRPVVLSVRADQANVVIEVSGMAPNANGEEIATAAVEAIARSLDGRLELYGGEAQVLARVVLPRGIDARADIGGTHSPR